MLTAETNPELPVQPSAEVAGLPSVGEIQLESIPGHTGGVDRVIERYGGRVEDCPFLKSLGEAGTKFIDEVRASEALPVRRLTIEERIAAKRQETSTSKATVAPKPSQEVSPKPSPEVSPKAYLKDKDPADHLKSATPMLPDQAIIDNSRILGIPDDTPALEPSVRSRPEQVVPPKDEAHVEPRREFEPYLQARQSADQREALQDAPAQTTTVEIPAVATAELTAARSEAILERVQNVQSAAHDAKHSVLDSSPFTSLSAISVEHVAVPTAVVPNVLETELETILPSSSNETANQEDSSESPDPEQQDSVSEVSLSPPLETSETSDELWGLLPAIDDSELGLANTNNDTETFMEEAAHEVIEADHSLEEMNETPQADDTFATSETYDTHETHETIETYDNDTQEPEQTPVTETAPILPLTNSENQPAEAMQPLELPSVLIENLDDSEAGRVNTLVEALLEQVTIVHTAEVDQPVELETAIAEIDELIRELCDVLQVDSDEVAVKDFRHQLTSRLEAHTPEGPATLDIDELNNRGTHEYKRTHHSSLVKNFIQQLAQMVAPYLRIGKYAVASSGLYL